MECGKKLPSQKNSTTPFLNWIQEWVTHSTFSSFISLLLWWIYAAIDRYKNNNHQPPISKLLTFFFIFIVNRFLSYIFSFRFLLHFWILTIINIPWSFKWLVVICSVDVKVIRMFVSFSFTTTNDVKSLLIYGSSNRERLSINENQSKQNQTCSTFFSVPSLLVHLMSHYMFHVRHIRYPDKYSFCFVFHCFI